MLTVQIQEEMALDTENEWMGGGVAGEIDEE